MFIMSGDSTPSSLIHVDVAFDFVFAIDTILHFYRPYVDTNTGETVADLRAMREKYLRSATFYINAIACIPLLKAPLSSVLRRQVLENVTIYFNVLRMVRILHLPSQFQELKRFCMQKGPVNESVFRMWVILFFTLLGMCIFGCFYFGLSTVFVDDVCPPSEDFAEEILSEEMWIANDFVITDLMDSRVCESLEKSRYGSKCNDCPQSLFFVRAIYFLMQTLFTIGYGDPVVPSRSAIEMALGCIFMVTGVFGYGLIIANMTSVLANIDVVSMRFRHEIDAISRWLSFRSTPESLRNRISMCFMYLSRTQHGMLDKHLFGDLPPKLSKDLAGLNLDLITKVPFFAPSSRTDAFLSLIASAFIRRVYAPGSYILYEGEKQRELVIVKSGRCDVTFKESSDAVGSLLPGDFMGDYQLLFGAKNQVGLKASDFVEALVLTFENFEQVMGHPDSKTFNFRAIGGNFRCSCDYGALDTIKRSRETLEKIMVTISNVSTQKKSNKLKDMMEKSDVVVKGYRILPHSPVHVWWDCFALSAIMYYCISCPVKLASYIRTDKLGSSYSPIFLLDYILDSSFMVDIYLRMRVYACVSYDNGRNEIVIDKDRIAAHYKNSNWFLIDIFSVIPFDLVSPATGYFALYRLSKMARVLQISPLISRLRSKLEECMQMTMNETQASSLIMFIYSVLIVVWSSAGWNALREGESAYHSVYWALTTLTTVGYGDFIPLNFRQTCYALFVGAAGATFSAAIIANVTSFFHDVEISEDSTEHKLNCLKRFMERHRVSQEHIKKVTDYFEYIVREQGGLNEDAMLNNFIPDNIKSDMMIHITKSMVLGSDFFDDCESGCVRKLMLSLEQRFFGKHYMVLTATTPADGMYFIKKGIVEILEELPDRSEKVSRKLEANDSFAEDCLLMHWEVNPFLAKAATDCELWFLSRSAFNRIVNDYPQVKALLCSRQHAAHSSVCGRRASTNAILKAAQKARRNRSIFIHPDKLFIRVWVGFVLLVTLYNTIALPFRVAYLENHTISISWLSADYIGDTLLFADLVIRGAFLAYYEDNSLVVSKWKIFTRYRISRQAKWHLLAAVPVELFAVFMPTFCPLWTLQTFSLFRLNKLSRLGETSFLLNQVESTLARIGIKLPRNQLRVGKLMMVILISAHLVGCIFFTIANLCQFRAEGDVEKQSNWASREGLLDSSQACPGEPVDTKRMWERCVAAMYWSMATLTTVGYGDITAHKNSISEIIFSTVVLVVGTAIYTLVIALLEDIVAQLDVTSTLHECKMSAIKDFAHMQGLPESVKSKISMYYENLWHRQFGVRGGNILKYLPRSLRSDLLFDTLSPLLERTFFVKDCSADFVANLLRSLKLDMYLADDIIFHEGEKCEELSFLFCGQVDLLTLENVKFKTVSKYILGESSFFGFEPFIYTAKCSSLCEIFQLNMEDFVDQLRNNHMLKKFLHYVKKNEDFLMTSKSSVEKMTKNLKSSKMAKMLIIEETEVTPFGIILPTSLFRNLWDAFALLAILIMAFTIPYQISFSRQGGIGWGQFFVDSIIDSFFIVDVYLKAFKFAVQRDGLLVTKPRDFRTIYFGGAFLLDAISLIPASAISFAIGRRRQGYGLLRLIQLTRIRLLTTHFDSVVEWHRLKTGKALSTAVLRTSQMFVGIIFLCHWVASMFHLIGDSAPNETNWMAMDGIAGADLELKYLRCFYWALYTISTIGYGSIKVVTVGERVFAMAAMVVGAVICDAGITAVLTSIIANRDHQASTNSRRIQSSKCFMKNNFINEDIQDRVLDYYAYANKQLRNIDEVSVLQDLSPILQANILAHFCFLPLRNSPFSTELSNGAIMSLVARMEPYLAIPGEEITAVGKECPAIFVLQRGLLTSKDSVGSKQQLSIGFIFGHAITLALEQRDGTPTDVLNIEIIDASGIKSKSGSPYLILTCGKKTCRSSIKRSTCWKEKIPIKVALSDIDEGELSVVVRGWRRNGFHTILGQAKVELLSGLKDDGIILASLSDAKGKCNGNISLRLERCKIPDEQVPSSHELTVTAEGYCHLYKLDLSELSHLTNYLSRSKQAKPFHRASSYLDEYNSGVLDLISASSSSETDDEVSRKNEIDDSGRDDASRGDNSTYKAHTCQRQDLSCERSQNPELYLRKKTNRTLHFIEQRRIAPSTANYDVEANIAHALAPFRSSSNASSQWSLRGHRRIKTGTIMERRSAHRQRTEKVSLTNCKPDEITGHTVDGHDNNEEKKWDELVSLASIVDSNWSKKLEAKPLMTTSQKVNRRERTTFFVDWELRKPPQPAG